MNQQSELDRYLEARLPESLAELKRFTSQPSISAQNIGMETTAKMAADLLSLRGFQVKIHSTPGFPVVVGSRKGRSEHTLLIYNHYDVQPPEPLDLWTSPPFQPEERDGKVYGRGISDDKGHIISRLFAIDALLEITGELPCTVKFILEGEEEIGSPHLPGFIREHRDLLQADACLWEFGGVDHRDVPQAYLGLRGLCYVELTAETANQDMHSGLGGSIFPNAAWRLAWALNSLKDRGEVIQLPGFYDPVIPPTERDIQMIAALESGLETYRKKFAIQDYLKPYPDDLAREVASVFEPTCTICGLNAGYQGPGSKTVQPARATAKLDFRLVPNQTPEQVLEGLRSHLDQQGFSDIQINYLGGEPPGRTDPDHPFVKLVAETAGEVYDQPMDLVPMIGASGPNHAFIHELSLPVVTAGIGYPGSNAHAPDENIRVDLYLKGVKHTARILQAIGEGSWQGE